MRFRITPVVLSAFAAASLQAQVHVPRAGLVRFPDGIVRTLEGLSGNLDVDPKPGFHADQISNSDSAGVVADQEHIRLLTRDFELIGEQDSREPAPVLDVT